MRFWMRSWPRRAKSRERGPVERAAPHPAAGTGRGAPLDVAGRRSACRAGRGRAGGLFARGARYRRAGPDVRRRDARLLGTGPRTAGHHPPAGRSRWRRALRDGEHRLPTICPGRPPSCVTAAASSSGPRPTFGFSRIPTATAGPTYRRQVFTGFGRANVQGLLNSFRWGLDGRIHGATSSAGGRIRSGEHPERPEVDVSGRDFSFDPAHARIPRRERRWAARNVLRRLGAEVRLLEQRSPAIGYVR